MTTPTFVLKRDLSDGSHFFVGTGISIVSTLPQARRFPTEAEARDFILRESPSFLGAYVPTPLSEVVS